MKIKIKALFVFCSLGSLLFINIDYIETGKKHTKGNPTTVETYCCTQLHQAAEKGHVACLANFVSKGGLQIARSHKVVLRPCIRQLVEATWTVWLH